MSPKKTYSFMIEPDLAEALKQAKNSDRSEGRIIRDALREWFERNGIMPRKKTPSRRAVTRRKG